MAITIPAQNQVSSVGLPGARQRTNASAQDFGGIGAEQLARTGQGLENAGAEMMRASTIMQERENADRLFRAETILKEKQLEWDRGLEEKKGVNAWDVTKQAEEFWNKETEALSKEFTNDRQREIFAQTVGRYRVGHIDKVARYESDQRRVSVEESAKGSIAASINSAAANATAWDPKSDSPDPVALAKDDIVKRNAVLAKINGWTPERAQLELANDTTTLHKQVINAWLDKDPRKAQEYYALNKEQILGTERNAIEDILNEGAVRLTAQEVGDKVIGEGMSETDALKYVRENFKGDEEVAAVTEVKTRFAEISVINNRAQQENSSKAWAVISEGGGRKQIPPEVWNALDGKERTQINEHLRVRADRLKAEAQGKEIKTDISALYDLRKMAVNDPTGFARMNLLASPEFAKLSRGDQEQMIGLQAEAAKGSTKFTEVQTIDTQITASIAPIGLSKTEAAIAENKVRAAIDVEGRLRGKPLDATERQKIIDRMFIEGEVISGSWFKADPNKRMYEVYGTEDAAKFLPQVPDSEVQAITEALKRAGRPVTDAAIADLYKQSQGL